MTISPTFSTAAELHSLRVILDPYPFYHWLRSREPVHWSEPMGMWIVTGYREATEALRNSCLSSRVDIVSNDGLAPAVQTELQPLFEMQGRWMQQSDPPEHTLLRAPWSKTFGSAVADQLGPGIDELARELVGRAASEGRGEFDIVGAFSPFPGLILGRALGLDKDEMTRLRPWIDEYVRFRSAPSLQTGRRALEAIRAWRAALAQISSERLNSARHSVLAEISRREGEDQLFATLTSLMSGKYEPTVGLIGNGMFALLRHPDQHPAALGSKFLVHTAVEEMLRYDCPFQSAQRLVRDDTSIGGSTVRAGEKVLVLLGAANRDPSRFAEPDAFRVGRTDQGHIAFGIGAHTCLGLSLAHAMARAAIGALVERLPQMRIIGTRPDWQFEIAGYRALRSLPVTIV